MKQRFSKRTRLVSALLTLAMVFTFLPSAPLRRARRTQRSILIRRILHLNSRMWNFSAFSEIVVT